jgi:hypothetical protein
LHDSYTGTTLLAIVRGGLRDIGYKDDLLRANYLFADILGPSAEVRRIDLAAFGQEPPSYRSSCFGVSTSPHKGPEAILAYRALGAPQIFALHPEEGIVDHWKIRAQGDPELLRQIDAEHVRSFIQDHRSEWSPDQVLRAKSLSFDREPRQLDFVDLGLIPVIDGVVQTKLDILLNEILAAIKHLYQEHFQSEPDYKALFRLVFRLVAAKLLADRQQPGNWNSSNAETAIKAVEDFYFKGAHKELVLPNEHFQDRAWSMLRNAFSFANLSVEALAYVYENTLVTPETRKKQDIHATPPEIAEYVVQQLPFEELARDQRRVFEPFAGHAPFLIAALGRLRTLSSDLDTAQRHEYLVRMLSGMEIDAFACEVAQYSLILADYPNSNGWRVENEDVFSSSQIDDYLRQADIVLCNPPFGDFTPEERRANTSIRSANKAVEALRRVLQHQPKMLGFVLPSAFRNGRSYRESRKQIAKLYENVDLVSLPKVAFQHSTAETVLLIAHGARSGQQRRRSLLVDRDNYQQFIQQGRPTWKTEVLVASPEDEAHPVLWHTPLHHVWDRLASLPRLGDIADVSRGIQYNIPFKANISRLTAEEPKPGFVKGLWNVQDGLEPYISTSFRYLSTEHQWRLYDAYGLPWEQPKVIANAAFLKVGRWSIAGAVDEQGLICSQRFHGIWPKSNVPIEVIAAIINSPVANAFVSTQRTSRDNQVRIVEAVPVPEFTFQQIDTITSLVHKYRSYREQWLEQPLQANHFEQLCRQFMYQIDAEVLAAYDLPPRLEKELLDYFAGYKRPGPVQFDRYYPPGFRPAIPWRLYISDVFRNSSARHTLERLPVIHDPVITAVVNALDE